MKKFVLLVIIPFLIHPQSGSEVYICYSKNATKYHKKEFCRGLGACKKEVKKVTLKEAKEMGLTLCRWEE